MDVLSRFGTHYVEAPYSKWVIGIRGLVGHEGRGGTEDRRDSDLGLRRSVSGASIRGLVTSSRP